MASFDNRPLLILGMHRSGTSCLTGCLEQAGVFLGRVNQQAKFNPKGNRENQAIVNLHNQMLARHDARWDNPPPDVIPPEPQDTEQLREIIKSYPQGQMIGFKDPRSLFCMPLWDAVTRPRFIGSFRHPLEVAGSLMRRAKAQKQDMSLEKALGLWRVYNGRMLAIYAKSPFPIIRYDLPPDIYMSNLRSVFPELGLPIDAAIDFREDKLKTQAESAPVPNDLSFIWDSLITLAVRA